MTQASTGSRALFVCRGSVKDGLGHVTRSRSVAMALGENCTVKMVVIGDDSAENLLSSYNIDFTITPHEEHACRYFEHFNPDVVVFDLIEIGEDFVRRVCESTKTVSLSPIFSAMHLVDVVFHRTRVHGKGWTVDGNGPIVRSGLDYTIISDHCSQVSEAAYKENLNHKTLSVAISMGGADAANKTLAILEKIRDVPDRVLIWVLLGEGYAHSYEDLVRSVRGSKHEIILAKTNDSMWRILNTCSLVILASGTTTYEAVHAGIPSINTLETEDHYFLIEELVERGSCVYAGYTFVESLNAIRGIITRFCRDRDELNRIHKNTHGLIDGRGASRVADEILAFCQTDEALASGSTANQ